MIPAFEPRVARKLAFFLGISAAAVGALVLFGWASNFAILKGFDPSGVTMKPNTALAALMSGLALALVSGARERVAHRFVASLAGAIVIALACLSMGEALLGWNLAIDRIIYRGLADSANPARSLRMSTQASFCFVLIGGALVLASQPWLARLRQPVIPALGASVIIIAAISLLGHFAFAAFGLHLWNYTAISTHTALALILLGCALLAWSQGIVKNFWVLDPIATGCFIFGAISILAIAGASFSFTSELGESDRWVTRTEEVLSEIEALTASQRDMTLSLGRYLLTGEESSVASRPRIKVAIQEGLERLRLLTSDDSSQQSRISEIEELTARRIALSDQILAAARSQPETAHSQYPNSFNGSASPLGVEYPATGESIDRVLDEMRSEEQSLLMQRETRSEATSARTFLLLPMGTFLSLVVLLLAMFYLNTNAAKQKVIEAAHNELEIFFRTIFEVTPDGILITDVERRVVMANPAAEEMFGYTKGALSGAPIGDLVPDALREDLTRERASLLDAPELGARGSAWQTEGVRKNRSTFPIEVLRSALPTTRGTFVLGVARDVTERQVVEESRSRMAAIVESSDDAIIGKNLDGIVSSWNKGAEKIFGYSAAEMIGQSILKIVPTDRLTEETDILSGIRLGEGIEHAETQRQTKDGRLIDVSISVSPILDSTGKVIGASKIARDITASKHLEQHLRQSQKMEAVGQLTGGVAHDFNNLLGVVIGNLDFLERLVSGNDSAIQRVKNAQRAALRGADLTRRMLAFSRREPLKAEPTSVAESVQNTIEMATRAVGPQITFIQDVEPSLPPILVDASQLENALLNLVLNARDAMPNGGSVLISAKVARIEESSQTGEALDVHAGDYVCVSVSDTGHGMSPETRQRIFEPFFTTKPRGKGTGLGLAMVYGFAKQSGGTARVYSEVGHGTTVTLYLPRTDEMAPARAVAVSVRRPQSGAGKTVLVVDDEADLLEVAVAYLEEMGYRVLHATDGARALEVLAREPNLDLLLTDVIMPGGIDGVELARRVRLVRPRVKVMFLSGFPSDALAQKSGMHVNALLLNKPYQRAAFAAAIAQVMDEVESVVDVIRPERSSLEA